MGVSIVARSLVAPWKILLLVGIFECHAYKVSQYRRNKCIASSNKCLTSSNKKNLIGIVVTSKESTSYLPLAA